MPPGIWKKNILVSLPSSGDDRQFCGGTGIMTSATALISQQNLPRTFDELARHLRITSYAAPSIIIDQQPGVGAQFALALMHLSFASVLLWHALRSLPGAVNAAACRRLARIPRSTLLATSTSGLVGWAGFFTMTAIFIWR
jgi:hypothetical protein